MQRAPGPVFCLCTAVLLLKILAPSCCNPYPWGMKCNSCLGQEMDGLLPHLLRKQSQGVVHLHLSGRQGLWPRVTGTNIYFCLQNRTEVSTCLCGSKHTYYIQRQEKRVQKAKEYDKPLHLLLVRRTEKCKRATISYWSFVRRNLTRWCGRI